MPCGSLIRPGFMFALVTAVTVAGPGSSALAQTTKTAQPSIGIPLPSIGLPLPTIGIQPNETNQHPPSGVQPPHRRHSRQRPSIVFFGAPYLFGVDAWQRSPVPGAIMVPAEPVASAPPELEIATGRLRFEIRPRDAQLFVNGEFVGTWEDIGGVLDLPEGTHRIEIRAPGYEAVAFDARIAIGRTITYRETLTPAAPRTPPTAAGSSSGVSAPPAPEPAAGATQTFYLIPGCYLGNVPPEQVKLPPGCDLSRVITHTPGK